MVTWVFVRSGRCAPCRLGNRSPTRRWGPPSTYVAGLFGHGAAGMPAHHPRGPPVLDAISLKHRPHHERSRFAVLIPSDTEIAHHEGGLALYTTERFRKRGIGFGRTASSSQAAPVEGLIVLPTVVLQGVAFRNIF